MIRLILGKEMEVLETFKDFESLNETCKYIFSIIQKIGPVTKSELIDVTKIKLTTFTSIAVGACAMVIQNLQN